MNSRFYRGIPLPDFFADGLLNFPRYQVFNLIPSLIEVIKLPVAIVAVIQNSVKASMGGALPNTAEFIGIASRGGMEDIAGTSSEATPVAGKVNVLNLVTKWRPATA